VHYQGSCGACWGITAVETIESAYAIYSGSLIDLAETEVIACDGTCEMCDGGWPQNAYEYTISNNGLPAENNLYYDGDFLYSLSSYVAGNGDGSLSTYEAESFFAATCPSGGRGDSSGSQSGSGDQNYGSYATYDSSQKRYGKIKGYGYTTDRCICYSDGTGCTCEDQDESLAVRNVASYGPATVCLEASLWQDYSSGIMTSDIGCTQEFADMNHCVQVVGYAYTDGSNNGDDYQDNEDSKSNSGDSGDDTQREGYWIVRNQWGSNWGMNGYAYVAMGSNTCGILNDMTQVYFN
jgi:cathepsin F